jgi:hypothetical protein
MPTCVVCCARAGTAQGGRSDADLLKIVENNFDLRPGCIIRDLNLLRPIYSKTACYSHFGQCSPFFRLLVRWPSLTFLSLLCVLRSRRQGLHLGTAQASEALNPALNRLTNYSSLSYHSRPVR